MQMTLTNFVTKEQSPQRFNHWSEALLLSSAMALGAENVPGWSDAERSLVLGLPKASAPTVRSFLAQIQEGKDPLGELFCQTRTPAERRPSGATYTPPRIIDAMLAGTKRKSSPDRVVDPGVGSARYLVRAGRAFPKATLWGIDSDPVATIMARGHLAAAGLADRATIELGDYRSLTLPSIGGKTLFIGNPPYVRHHLIEPEWKEWLTTKAAGLGLHASQLAGLHVHFFLASALLGKPGDYGAFITAAEWLDVNYGSLVRELFLGKLGGRSITIIEPTALPFADAATTAAITYFEAGSVPPEVRFQRVASLGDLSSSKGTRTVRRERLETEKRWSHLSRATKPVPPGFVELGELCRVHRGQVTGANSIWIAGAHSEGLPEAVLFPTVTKARELIAAGDTLSDASRLRRVIDIPVDLDEFDRLDKKRIEAFLRNARAMGADQGYVAQARRAWWSVGLRQPAPILATYMARRPPAFVRNSASARHINIAHGLYPREPLSETILSALLGYLRQAILQSDGRTYAGGLTKFEPREMERIFVPSPELLTTGSYERLAHMDDRATCS